MATLGYPALVGVAQPLEMCYLFVVSLMPSLAGPLNAQLLLLQALATTVALLTAPLAHACIFVALAVWLCLMLVYLPSPDGL